MRKFSHASGTAGSILEGLETSDPAMKPCPEAELTRSEWRADPRTSRPREESPGTLVEPSDSHGPTPISQRRGHRDPETAKSRNVAMAGPRPERSLLTPGPCALCLAVHATVNIHRSPLLWARNLTGFHTGLAWEYACRPHSPSSGTREGFE